MKRFGLLTILPLLFAEDAVVLLMWVILLLFESVLIGFLLKLIFPVLIRSSCFALLFSWNTSEKYLSFFSGFLIAGFSFLLSSVLRISEFLLFFMFLMKLPR